MLFCHVTSHVEGEKYPDLLGQTGGGGWPHIVVMDASGKVLAKHVPEAGIARGQFRTTEGFRMTLDQAMEAGEQMTALAELAAEGDLESALELLEMRVDLAHLNAEEARRQLAELDGIEARSRAALDQKITEVEVNAIMTTASNEISTQIACGRKFAGMLEQGRVPKAGGSMYYWYFLAVYAESEKKVDLLARAVEGLKKEQNFPANSLKSLQEALAKLREGTQ